MLTAKLNTELTQSDLSQFGASRSTIQYLNDNDYHVVVKSEWLEIWHDYVLYSVVSRLNAEQLNEFMYHGEKEIRDEILEMCVK